MAKTITTKKKDSKIELDLSYPKGPGDTSSVIHMVFGSIFGLWIALLFSSRFPNGTIYSFLFMVYALAFIGTLAVILQAAFTRKVRGQRFIAYTILLLCCFLVVPGISSASNLAYAVDQLIKPEEVWFVAIIIPVWCITAEWGSGLVGFFENK